MAGTKRKTTSKIEEPKSTILCTCCGVEKAEKNFYMSKSYIYKAINKVPICKKCIGTVYDKYYEKNKIEKLSIYYMCRALGICFNLASFNGAISELEKGSKDTPIWQVYMTKLNSLGGVNGAGDDFDGSDNIDVEEVKENSSVIDKEVVKRWGRSFTDDELQWLEDDYLDWTTHNDCSKLSVQRLVQMICIKELEIRTARSKGDSTEKLEKALLTLMDNSSLTPKTMSAINETDSAKVYGIWLKDIEKYRPAEYFQDKSIYFDFDHIKEYFERFILRPLKNLLTGSRDFDKEFNVENDDDYVDYNEEEDNE